MTKAELEKEVKRLKRKIRRWQKLYDWKRMADNYHKNVAIENLGPEPKVPQYE